MQMKSLQGRLTKQEKAEGDRKREVEYLKQELVCNEQAKEESENILVKLQEQLEQEKHALHKQAQQVTSCPYMNVCVCALTRLNTLSIYFKK